MNPPNPAFWQDRAKSYTVKSSCLKIQSFVSMYFLLIVKKCNTGEPPLLSETSNGICFLHSVFVMELVKKFLKA